MAIEGDSKLEQGMSEAENCDHEEHQNPGLDSEEGIEKFKQQTLLLFKSSFLKNNGELSPSAAIITQWHPTRKTAFNKPCILIATALTDVAVKLNEVATVIRNIVAELQGAGVMVGFEHQMKKEGEVWREAEKGEDYIFSIVVIFEHKSFANKMWVAPITETPGPTSEQIFITVEPWEECALPKIMAGLIEKAH